MRTEDRPNDKERIGPGEDFSKLAEGLEPITRELEAIRERSRGSMRFGHSIVKRLGGSYVLVKISESSGIRYDLNRAFGKYGDWIVSGAVSMILTPNYAKSAHPDFVTNMARELLGITDSFEPSMVTDLLPKTGLNKQAAEAVMSSRISRAKNILVTDTPFLGEYEESQDDDLRSMWISTDEQGIPVHYTTDTIGGLKELGLDGYQNNLRILGAKDRIFILEKRTGNADLYERLIERGSKFISLPKVHTTCIENISTKISEHGTIIERNGKQFMVYSTNVAVVSKRVRNNPVDPEDNDNTDTLDIVTDEDPRFSESLPDHRFNLWAFKPLEDSGVDRERTERRIAVIERRLRKLDPQDAMDQFQETTGSLARFFHIELKNGELILDIKRKDLDLYLNQTCHTMFSYGFDSWNTMMDTFDSRMKFDTALKALNGKLEVTSEFIDEGADRGRRFTLFVAMILWCTVAQKLKEANIDVDVDTAMEWLDSVMAFGDGITWKVVGITPRNRKVMSALGVKPPKSDLVTFPYDYKAEEESNNEFT